MSTFHNAVVTVLNLLLMFSVLVVVHEWGHFIVARIFKIRVDEFSLGFGPRMLRIGKRGDTEYNIRWALLGGYVKIAGMEPDEQPITDMRDKAKGLLAAKDPNKTEIPLVAENTSDRAEDEEQRRRDAIDGFYSKPGWQRALVIFAGPLMSFVLGIVLLCSAGFIFGVADRALNVVDSVNPHSVAQKMGLRAHDKIIRIGTTPITNGETMVTTIHASLNKPLTLTVVRGARTLTLHGTPQLAKDPTGTVVKVDGKPVGALGFSPAFHYRRIGAWQSVKYGFAITDALMSLIGQKFQHISGIAQSTGGVIEMASYTNDAAQQGPMVVLDLWAQLTISLALFNLLPIPVLDGGHLLIIAIEGIRRGRRLTLQQQQNFMIAGLAIIATLFILMTTRGVIRLIEGKLPHIY